MQTKESFKTHSRYGTSTLCGNCYRSIFDCQCPRPKVVVEMTPSNETQAPLAGHTPGSWNLTSSLDGLVQNIAANGEHIARVAGGSRERVEANARLIAAAPTLLAERDALLAQRDALEAEKAKLVAALAEYRGFVGNTGWTCRDNRERARELYDASSAILALAAGRSSK